MFDVLLANKPRIKTTIFYPQKQKAIVDFLINKFQTRSFLIRRIYFLRRVLTLSKNNGVIYHQGGYPKFHYQKKYIVKKNSLKENKKLITWRHEFTLDNKLAPPYSITTIRQHIEYLIFKVFLNEDRNRQFRGKLNLLGYKVLELEIISFGKISLGSFKSPSLKLFNKFVFKDILL